MSVVSVCPPAGSPMVIITRHSPVKGNRVQVISEARVEERAEVYGGVDTHRDIHVAAAIDPAGRLSGAKSFAVNPAGCAQPGRWLNAHGPVTRVGVQGTGSCGTGLTRHLSGQRLDGVEVDQPNRQPRRPRRRNRHRRRLRGGLCDRHRAKPTPRRKPPTVPWKRSECCTWAMNQRSEPEPVASTNSKRSSSQLQRIHAADQTAKPPQTRSRHALGSGPPTAMRWMRSRETTLKNPAERYQQLTAEINDYRAQLKQLGAQANPALLAAYTRGLRNRVGDG